jgi:hypothetical protein
VPEPYLLKQSHTEKVCENICYLSNSLGLGQKEITLARTAALLHDIGRFSQFKDYGTFSDPLSKNHAALGVKVIMRNGLLNNLTAVERRLVIRAIVLHNRAELPENLSPDLRHLTRMLRDADKIDIFKVMADLYQTVHNDSRNYITHSHPDNKKIPADLVEQISLGKRIDYSQVNSLNGMKLFQISMIFDVNFPASFKIIREMDILRIFLRSMPDSADLNAIEHFLNRYIEKKISQ